MRGSSDFEAQLFQQDTLIPNQYWETLRRKGGLEREQKLMLAVLEDATWIYIKCFSKKNTLFLEVEDWFRHKGNDRLFSFENICDVLGLSADYIRRGLRVWRSTQMARSPKCGLRRARSYRRRHRNFYSDRWKDKTTERPTGTG
jgi:hypothetical protein